MIAVPEPAPCRHASPRAVWSLMAGLAVVASKPEAAAIYLARLEAVVNVPRAPAAQEQR